MQNKKRLIYAEDLFTPVDFTVLRLGKSGSGKTMAMYEKLFRKRVEMAPTVDAVKVVHGRWVSSGLGFDCCSECRKVYMAGYFTIGGNKPRPNFNYCPNCGAKMDGGNEDA